MKVSLTVLVSGPMQGKKIPITIPRFLIGRGPACNLQPGNLTISKTHCVLKLVGNRVLVEDLRSSSGTFVNDQKIAGEIELKDGDQLKIGPLIFGLTIEAVEEPVSPKPALEKTPKPVPGTGVMPASAVAAAENKRKPVPETDVMPATAVAAAAGETGEMSLKTGDTVADNRPKPEQKPADTAAAAKALLKKYLRRKRNMDEPMV